MKSSFSKPRLMNARTTGHDALCLYYLSKKDNLKEKKKRKAEKKASKKVENMTEKYASNSFLWPKSRVAKKLRYNLCCEP